MLRLWLFSLKQLRLKGDLIEDKTWEYSLLICGKMEGRNFTQEEWRSRNNTQKDRHLKEQQDKHNENEVQTTPLRHFQLTCYNWTNSLLLNNFCTNDHKTKYLCTKDISITWFISFKAQVLIKWIMYINM